jgi:hypothetical protein
MSSFTSSRAIRNLPSASHLQTMSKRLRIVGAPESFGPLTHVARPVVAATSPAPIVESATISSEDIVTCGATASRAARPSIAGDPGPTKIASSV